MDCANYLRQGSFCTKVLAGHANKLKQLTTFSTYPLKWSNNEIITNNNNGKLGQLNGSNQNYCQAWAQGALWIGAPATTP